MNFQLDIRDCVIAIVISDYGSYVNGCRRKGTDIGLARRTRDNKDIYQRTGRTKTSIMALLAAARGLPPNVVLDTKARSGRPRKTSTCTDFVIRRELRMNPHVYASGLKEMHPDLLEEVSIRCIQHRLQKDLKLPSCHAAQKPRLTLRMGKQRIQHAKRYLHWSVDDWKVMWSD